MDKTLVMGNAAAAYGALAAGINVIAGYPGTPSSELLETAASYIKDEVAAGRIPTSDAPHVEWSVNEKAALELAFGASLSGARALVTMKQVGLNVAADPLMTIAYLGVKGGLVLFVADDPGPISSQTEQDTRQFAQFAKVPLLDATNPEELFSLMRNAFDLSEQHALPVIVRATTRVCHGSAPLEIPKEYRAHQYEGFVKDPQWVIFPPLAYKAHQSMPQRFEEIIKDPLFCGLNHTVPSSEGSSNIGLVAGGVSWSYLLDALEQRGQIGDFDLYKVGAPFPFDDKHAADFLRQHEQVIVFEELEPTIERELLRVAGAQHLPVSVLGKLTQDTAFAGENSVQSIACDLSRLLDEESSTTMSTTEGAKDLLLPRPPVLCAGCPHRASFYAVKMALKGVKATYSGDIGCYTLGNALPLNMTDTCVCMGAGFTVPQGMHWAEDEVRHFGFVGDSTFFASGITGVINAVYNQAPVTLVVLDNSLTAMTGSQPHPGTGLRMSYDATAEDASRAISIPRVLEALGVQSVRTVNPLDLSEAISAVKATVDETGVNALVFQAPCINVSVPRPCPQVDAELCTACRVCIESIGCPALVMDEHEQVIRIDGELCNGCDLCTQICPFSALVSNNE